MTDEIQFRTLALDTKRADDSARRVEASLSSEEPVPRFFGHEILSHRADAIDLSKAVEGLPLLFSHDPLTVVGIAERIRISGTKLKASLRFGHTPKADELWSLVKDSILCGMSIGYRVLAMERSGETSTGESLFTVTKWQPIEASLAAVPADPSIGVGRSFIPQSIPQHNHSNSFGVM